MADERGDAATPSPPTPAPRASSPGARPDAEPIEDLKADAIFGLEILERIGEGSFSLVYRARRGDEILALKIQRSPSTSPSARRRAWRPRATLAIVRHPGLPATRSVGEHGGRIYLVMEYPRDRRDDRL